MKKLTLALIFLAGVYTQHAEAQTAGTGSDKGLDLSLMDKSVRPQDDFYNYVSGTWMKTAKYLLINLLGKLQQIGRRYGQQLDENSELSSKR